MEKFRQLSEFATLAQKLLYPQECFPLNFPTESENCRASDKLKRNQKILPEDSGSQLF